MNRLTPQIYSDSDGDTDAVVGVSVDQTEVVEDWSDDLHPRVSGSSRSYGHASSTSPIDWGHSYGWRKKNSGSGSNNTRSGSSSGGWGSGKYNRGGFVRQWGEYPSHSGLKDDAVKLNPTPTVEDDSRRNLFIERAWSAGEGKWAVDEVKEGVVVERKGSGDDVEPTTQMATMEMIDEMGT